jgi:hypothetical protein
MGYPSEFRPLGPPRDNRGSHLATDKVLRNDRSTATNVHVVPLVDEIGTTLTMPNNGNQYRQNLTSQIFGTGRALGAGDGVGNLLSEFWMLVPNSFDFVDQPWRIVCQPGEEAFGTFYLLNMLFKSDAEALEFGS